MTEPIPSRLTRRSLMPLLCALLILAGAFPLSAREEDGGATTRRVVVDPMTGFAIGGYDPVAYFAEGRAVEGQSRIEASWGGAIWRFANLGNRDAFLEAPDIYAPRFGGYCARGAAIGVAVEGDPRVFAIHGGHLYFFHTESDRARWRLAPDPHIGAAEKNWPRLEQMLAE